MFTVKQKGSFSNIEKFFNIVLRRDYLNVVDHYGQLGVEALAAATPKQTGATANSWYYEITSDSKSTTLAFDNSNVKNGVNIAIILNYGHGTRQGAYVKGRRFINPAVRPVFDKLADQVWKEIVDS